MAKKQAKRAKKLTLLDKLPKNRKEYLQLLLYFTERVVSTHGTDLDEMMKNQGNRLKNEIKALK